MNTTQVFEEHQIIWVCSPILAANLPWEYTHLIDICIESCVTVVYAWLPDSGVVLLGMISYEEGKDNVPSPGRREGKYRII